MVTNIETVKLPKELINVVWGNTIDSSIFDRWSQSFKFSCDEKSALIQDEGGPCSVLTTVQAYLLNELIFCKRCQFNWRQTSQEEIDLHFLNALLKILLLLSIDQKQIYLPNFSNDNFTTKLSTKEFHEKITFKICQSNIDLKQEIFVRLNMWKNTYGVLLFLYSCLMTKTIDLLKKEIDDETSLPLIDQAHGHGSQCLTNLLITSFATPHCFDGEKDLAGLKLYGIRQKANIGFLSSLEVYRLLEVGWFLKNPKYPIWIIGSETHLTVLFSREQSLLEQDQTPFQKASTIFTKYDTEKNGFISISLIDQVLNELYQEQLIKTIPDINQFKRIVDPDNTQIVLKSLFLNQLFPQDEFNSTNQQQLTTFNGKPFVIYHYNGLPRSNKDKKVVYASAQAVITDYGYGNDIPSTAVTPVQPGIHLPITDVLRTKWPTIELKWDDNVKPSLN